MYNIFYLVGRPGSMQPWLKRKWEPPTPGMTEDELLAAALDAMAQRHKLDPQFIVIQSMIDVDHRAPVKF